MQIKDVPFCTINWNEVKRIEKPGIGGKAYWRVFEQGNIRVRMVEYTPGYLADHWCEKGHVILVLEGEMETELQDGRKFTLKQGMSYQVADGIDAHRTYTKDGVKLFIVD